MVRYPSPTLGSLPLPISLRSLSPILAATFMPPRGRPTLVVVASPVPVLKFFIVSAERAPAANDTRQWPGSGYVAAAH